MDDVEAQRLSKILWDCREVVDMFSDLTRRHGRTSPYLMRLREAIDTYRADKGWPLNGFGGETGHTDPTEIELTDPNEGEPS